MLDRVILAYGPGAADVAARAKAFLMGSYSTTLFAARMRFAFAPELMIAAGKVDTFQSLALACQALRSGKTRYRVLAWSEKAPWESWARSMPVHRVFVGEPLGRFDAMNRCSDLLCRLSIPPERLEDLIRDAVDP